MSLSMQASSTAVFARALANLKHVLERGEAWAKEHNVSDGVLLGTRLIPDMFPLLKQVQIACDTAARSAARLANVEPKPFPDEEATLADVQARLDATIAYVESFTAGQLEGAEARTISVPRRSGKIELNGSDYLYHYALPNFFFHCTTAYALLRAAGVQIGKNDFLGQL